MGDEQPFKNQYFNNFEDGLYKSVCSGVILFSSADKLESKLGYCCFAKPA